MKHDLRPCTGAADIVPSFFQKSPLDVLPASWDWVNWLAVDVNGVSDTIVSAVITGDGLSVGNVGVPRTRWTFIVAAQRARLCPVVEDIIFS
jgi:hypothetical protein